MNRFDRRTREGREHLEFVRERLDEVMLGSPATAPLVRAKPISKKYKRALMRRVQ